MAPEIQALRERFRDQMPGMAEFDELAAKYERLLTAQQHLEQRWGLGDPAKVTVLRTIVQTILEAPSVSDAIKSRIRDALKAGGIS